MESGDIQEIIDSYDQEFIEKINIDQAVSIYKYLLNEKIYYAKDIMIGYIDLFYYSLDEFKEKFNKLKNYLGDDYLNKLEQDMGLFQLIHKL